ncbi:cotranscriptional regulator FAM172A homolog [Megalops cyprinoides]|uniref:cotranscriptional regulator FAM172A homolog n=1 Tax=Megalops cyprinoides TaxID=118141 RepID=UPI001863C9E6|nr:cotranscriptional regulator FAM172A homolog [Megalops cyprinoides]
MEVQESEGEAASALWDFPYSFTQDGRLLHRETRESFAFRFRRGAAREAECRYRALWNCITQHVYCLLEERCRLCRVRLPAAPGDPEGGALIFTSPRAMEGPGTLLVLIQDQGMVRAGQWSWRAIARDGLDRGSQIPYVERALKENWGMVIMNPNENTGEAGLGASPEEHVLRVWDGCLSGRAAGRVAVVTHGYGGVAFVDLLLRRLQEVQRQVCAVAFLDSSHNLWHQPLGVAGREWLRAHSRQWVLSSKPLNRPVGSLKAACFQLSAGTQCHEAAPAVCMDSVFRFFVKAMRARPTPTPFDIVTRSRSQGQGNPSGGATGPRDVNGNKM